MFKKPFSFKGRIRRTEFGLSYLIYFFGTMLTLGFGIVITLPFILAQAAKRSHDIGNSGWFILIPIYNPFFLLFAEGETESNEYGENPKLVSGQNNDAQKSKASGSEVIGNNKNTASQNPPSLNSPISNTNQFPPPTNQGPPHRQHLGLRAHRRRLARNVDSPDVAYVFERSFQRDLSLLSCKLYLSQCHL